MNMTYSDSSGDNTGSCDDSSQQPPEEALNSFLLCSHNWACNDSADSNRNPLPNRLQSWNYACHRVSRFTSRKQWILLTNQLELTLLLLLSNFLQGTRIRLLLLRINLKLFHLYKANNSVYYILYTLLITLLFLF